MYHPNATGANDGGPLCFINNTRVCGPDCMAFLPQAPSGDDYKGEQWAHCHLLVNAHRSGKHLTILANVHSQANAVAKRSVPAPAGG